MPFRLSNRWGAKLRASAINPATPLVGISCVARSWFPKNDREGAVPVAYPFGSVSAPFVRSILRVGFFIADY